MEGGGVKIKFILAILFTSFFVFVLFGCSSTRDKVTENKFIEELIKHKKDDVLSIDLSSIFGNNWRKICIQGPYTQKNEFEKKAGEKLDSLPLIASNEHALLIFYQNRDFRYIKFEEVAVMDWLSNAPNSSTCADYSHPLLSLSYDKDGYKKFFLESTGK